MARALAHLDETETDVAEAESAQDSLSVLPLSAMPISTPGLRSARLVKNSQLEGVVELFSGAHTGSGQIYPCDLRKVFQFDQQNETDIGVVQSLSSLPSYDVYSLRLQLRRLDIRVDDHDELRLSPQRVRELSAYMRAFTEPLIAAVFDETKAVERDHSDLLGLFADPDNAKARRNLTRLAERLELELADIPRLMEDFGDIYLSLSYYQHCLSKNLPILVSFIKSMRELRQHPRYTHDPAFQQTCKQLDIKLRNLCGEVKGILDVFQKRTRNMWYNPSKEDFEGLRDMVSGYHVKIGGALCAISVKMNAWGDNFYMEGSDTASPIKRADFIMNEMRHGIGSIESIKFSEQS